MRHKYRISKPSDLADQSAGGGGQKRRSKPEATNKNKSLHSEQILFDSVLLPSIVPGFHITIWIKSSSDNACLLCSICRAGSRYSWGMGNHARNP